MTMSVVGRSARVITAIGLGGAMLAGCGSSGSTPSGSSPPGSSSSVSGPTANVPSAVTSGEIRTSAPGPSVSERAPVSCGRVPESSGPASAVARLVLTAPSDARAGSTVAVQGRLEVHGDAPRIVTGAVGSQILVVRDGAVVGGTSRTSAPIPVPLRAGTTRPAQALPESVRLVGCTVDTAAADLPPGEYDLVGVLAYGGDPLNGVPDGVAGARTFALVSAPVPIRVR